MNSSENWILRVRPKVFKALQKFPAKERNVLLFVIDSLSFDVFVGDIEKLKGEDNVWRRRIGNYRIKYELLKDEGVVYVFDIERRTSSTY